MKEQILELLNDWWVIFWFVISIAFLVLAAISAMHNEVEKTIACVGVSMACQARCEVKILQRKIENDT